MSAGGGKYVKKIFEYLYLVLDEVKSDVRGKVLFLLDTDKCHESYTAKESIKKIMIRRIQNIPSSAATELRKTSDNNIYPPTEIEDTLDPVVFYETLKHFYDSGQKNLMNTLDELKIYEENKPSGLAFDLRQSNKDEIEKFFNIIGMKTNFAKMYCKIDKNIKKTHLIIEIEKLLNNN